MYWKTEKSEIETLIEQDGIEHATRRFAEIICDMLKTREFAYQFTLEEIEAASQGNDAAIKFSSESGILLSEYQGAMQRSCPEVDGEGGPQQLLLNLSLQLSSDADLMVEFRTMIVDKVMKNFYLGKYGNGEPIGSDTSWMDALIEWANKNNLPDREVVEGMYDSEYIGFPKDQESISFLSNFDRFSKGSFDDSSKSLQINLINYNITSLPKEFFRLIGIHTLYLHNNNLEEIPSEIGNLINVYRLDLGKNNIQSIPDSICNLRHLEYLNLYDNNLTKLPNKIVNLNMLRMLNLANNKNLILTAEQKEWVNSFDEDDIFIDDDLLDRFDEDELHIDDDLLDSIKLTQEQIIENTVILSITQSGKILFTHPYLVSQDKDVQEGRCIEVMITFPNLVPYFVYYYNEDYYNSVSLNTGTPEDSEENRANISNLLSNTLRDWLLKDKDIEIDVNTGSYRHNYANTNTLIFVKDLNEWFPIRHAMDEGEDAAEIKAMRVSSGLSDITEYISVNELSPRWAN